MCIPFLFLDGAAGEKFLIGEEIFLVFRENEDFHINLRKHSKFFKISVVWYAVITLHK